MRFVCVRVISLVLPMLAAVPALGEIQLYRGTMEAVTAPGAACEGVLGKHPATVVITGDSARTGLNGYFESDGLEVGKLVGPDPAHLKVGFPWQHNSGNTIALIRSGATGLTGELNGAIAVKHCTFDTGRLTLELVADEKAAEATLKRLATLFEAKAALFQAFSLFRTGNGEAALPLFEKSLGLADTAFWQGSPQLNPFVTGLATCYVKLGRTKEFNALYDQRIGAGSDEQLKTMLLKLRVSLLAQEGRTLLAQAEYDAALKVLKQAYQIDPKNRDSIHIVMAAYIRSGRYDEAIVFLEQAGPKLEQEADRKEISAITALVYFKKGLKDGKNGKGTEAEASLRKAIALDPQRAEYLEALARLLHKSGHFDDAEKLLSQGLEQITDEPSRKEIMAAQEKLRQTEMIIKKLQ